MYCGWLSGKRFSRIFSDVEVCRNVLLQLSGVEFTKETLQKNKAIGLFPSLEENSVASAFKSCTAVDKVAKFCESSDRILKSIATSLASKFDAILSTKKRRRKATGELLKFSYFNL